MKRRHRGIIVLHPTVKIADEDLQALREAGYVPIQAEGDKVIVRMPPLELDGGQLTTAALQSVARDPSGASRFGHIMLEHALAQIGYGLNPDGSLVRLRK